MQVVQFRIQRFRNIETLCITPKQRWIYLSGANGQGKTNLLEALYVCVTGKSFRQVPNRELIGFGQDSTSCWLQFERQAVAHELTLLLTPQKKQFSLDNRQLHQRSDLLQAMNVVAFFPDDLQLIKGPPELRRKYIDKLIGGLYPQALAIWKRYATLLAHRNSLLRKQALQGDLQQTLDLQLAHAGTELRRLRSQGIGQLAPHIEQAMQELCHGQVLTHMIASSSTPGQTVGEAWQDPHWLFKQLQKQLPLDRLRKSTSTGPHRDDVIWSYQGRSARQFCSQGQQRALVLACKLAELRAYAQHLGQPPLLLLDDVASELDAGRMAKFFAAVHQEGCQVWLTSALGNDPVDLPPGDWYQVQAGALVPRRLACKSA